MAFHRLFEPASSGEPFPLYGGGTAIRDFTHVSDVERANLLAASSDATPWDIVNVSGGGSVSMSDVIADVEALAGSPVNIERKDMQRGDVRRTGRSKGRARQRLGWSPQMTLADGLTTQFEWHRSRGA